jgi:hypothetical protein
MSTSFTRGENPLRADKLNQAFSERVSRGGDTMQGMLTLWADPVYARDAATKQYVDTKFSNIVIPPQQPGGVISFNTRSGVVVQISADITGALGYTPYDAANPAGYITAAQAATAAPVQSFNTRTGAIVLTSADVTTALTYTPYNATNPAGYQTAAQVAAALGPYALTSSLPVASSTLPLIEGTAAIGTSTAYARADHVHPATTGASVYIGDTPPP